VRLWTPVRLWIPRQRFFFESSKAKALDSSEALDSGEALDSSKALDFNVLFGLKNMILSKHFVFIHFPKTGGSFVRAVCQEYAPADWKVQMIDEHPTIRDIPNAYQSLPKLGFVRNPYSWYVSGYSYLRERADNKAFNKISNHGEKNFKSTILAILNLDMDDFEPGAIGGYSWHVKNLFGDDLQALRIGKFEELRHELLRIMNSVVMLPESFVKAVQTYPAVNVSQHDHYRTYYDDELREIIAEKDRWIFEQFGYEF
jgi:hypothetical protein